MANLGAEVHIAVTKSGGQLEHELNGTKNVFLHTITTGNNLVEKFKYLTQLRTLIKSTEFNAVYGFLPTPNLALLIALTIRNRPVIAWGVRSSGLDLTQYRSKVKWTMLLEKLLSRFADKIITNSKAAFQEYRKAGYPYSKLRHVPNAIDTERFKPHPKARNSIRNQLAISVEAPLIGLFARIHPMKDHTTFLHAAKLLVDVNPDVRFICAGGVHDEHSNLAIALKSSANKLGLDGHILWLGARKDPERLMGACDITTLTSDNGEGFPNAVAESMACGVPCVVTDIGDASNIVADFSEVVPPNNPQALTTAWKSALDKTVIERSHKSIQMRQSIIDRFTSSVIAKKNLDILLK